MLTKRLIPLLVSINLLLFLNTANAQVYTVLEDTFTVKASSDKNVSVAYGNIASQSSDPITIVWERTVENYPSNFGGTQICDKNQCYAPSIDSQGFVLPANDTTKLDVHFINKENTGQAYVKVKVYVDRDSAATVSYIHYRTEQVTSTNETSEKLRANAASSINIYPNPVEDYLQVKNQGNQDIKKIAVYNILGSKVLTHRAEPNAIINRLNMQDLKKGIYTVRVYGDNNRVLMTKSVSKAR
ncbi:MAG: hypothetical protein BRD50_01775 [Bacteroidetes bacterium SW_11_45_7]|nr:MAG: hypothetical protein BRD50_01775 [Bacteroidetes bacterium SW_11_45_7]